MLLQARHQIGGIGIAARMRRVLGADAAGGIAAQRHDMAHACRLVAARDLVDLRLGRLHAGQVRGRHQRRLAGEPRHGRVRALARRAAGAIGHRHEPGLQRLEPPDRRPQRLLHLLRLGREELEGDVDVAVAEQAAAALLGAVHLKQSAPACARFYRFCAAAAACGRAATHTDTVSFAVPLSTPGARSRRLHHL